MRTGFNFVPELGHECFGPEKTYLLRCGSLLFSFSVQTIVASAEVYLYG